MIRMKRFFFFILFTILLSHLALPLYGESSQGQKYKSVKDTGTGQMQAFPLMPDPGKKVPIGSDYYLIYGFDKKPKLGPVIMKVEIFTKEGNKDTSFEVKGNTDMPSMRGAHATGDKAFTLSKRGDYLLPIGIVMPGEWEIRLTVTKDGKTLLRGRYNFNV